jgi:hypothetical protein
MLDNNKKKCLLEIKIKEKKLNWKKKENKN